MDRSFEQIRTEVLELDPESRRKLAEEIEHTLVEPDQANDSAWKKEMARRMEAHRRGEGTYVTREHMMDMAEKMIVAAERKKK